MKPWKRILLLVVVAVTILSLLLSACGPIERVRGNAKNESDHDRDKVKDNGKDKDKDQDKGPDKAGKAEKILICHKTGSAKNPYVLISVPDDAAKDGHGTHAGDLIPAPEEGCPKKGIDLPAK